MPYTTLDFHPEKGMLPNHVGLIPDGTRRWAKENKISLSEAYINAMQNITYSLDFFFQQGIKAVSIYLSSIQNLRRSSDEIDALFRAEVLLYDAMLPHIAKKFEAKVTTAGKTDLLPDYLQTSINSITYNTSGYSSTRLYLCNAYSPLDEVINALNNSGNTDSFINYLWVPEPLDLVIRTSGANLLSNFLPLQSGYARIYTIDKLFNDASIKDFNNILTDFKNLTRLYGD